MKQLNTTFKHANPFFTAKQKLLCALGIFCSSMAFAQPPAATSPILGNAATFAVFGGNAGVTNSGTNTIAHGSIGTVAASSTVIGFHDGVTGAIYGETGLSVGNATGGIYTNVPAPGTAITFAFATKTLADANTAYNNISPAAQPGGIDPGAGELGGLTLTPGVYKATTFKISNVDLTLDAQGNPDAVWVFQTAAALTVGISGPTGARSVKMINGGLPRNVFWYVGSAATINGAGGGTMVGTIIAYSAITFSTAGNAVQTVLNGRALSLNASVTMVNTTVNATDTWTGLTSNAWTTSTNWSTGSAPINSDEVLIPNVSTNQPIINTGISSLYNLTLYNGSALTVNNSTLQIGGFINNLGNAFAATLGTIAMNGSLSQTIPSATFTNGNTVQNLITNNLSGVSLVGDITVTNLLTLTNGLLTTNNSNLIIANNATINGASTTRYIDGNLRKVGNQAFTFPVGMNSKYAPISISAPLNINDHFTAIYKAANPNSSYPIASLGSGLNNVSSTEYWLLNRTNGTSNVDVTLSFDALRSNGISSLPDLRVAAWNGLQWTNQGNTATTGTNANGTVKSNAALSTFGPFTIGSSSASNALPVNIVFFIAQQFNSNIVLKWQTTNEVNASHFNLQRSLDAVTFTTVGKVAAKGAGNYIFNDQASTSSTSAIYYRLQMVDNDGSFTYSQTVAIKLNGNNALPLSIYPNPVKETMFVQLSTIKADKLTLQVADINGKILLQQIAQVNTGNVSLSINVSALAKGSYVLLIKGDGIIQQKQFIKE